MSNGNSLRGVQPLYTGLGKAYEVYQSWSYEGSGTSAQDQYDAQLPVVRTGTGVYTLTFPSDKKPNSVLHCTFSFSLPGTTATWAYSAGVLTVTVWRDAAGDGTWEEANTDEEIIKVRILCTK